MKELVKHPDVTSLFKYCPIGKNQLSALAQKKIWYSKPAGFNDPFDTRFSVTGKKHVYVQETDSQKLRQMFDEDMNDAVVHKKVSLEVALDQFRTGIEELGILSLANSNTNLLMWSHYAAEHKGMCLEFERNADTKLSDSEAAKPIHYTDNHPTLSAKALLNQVDTLSSQRRILYSKSKHWEYEQEWRHIVEYGNQLHSWPAPLIAVYFGCKAEEPDINLVKSVISDPKVKYYKGYQYSDTFGIYFQLV
ncbi:DUF2971 domain-containing protein [Shewanella baltica]|uniref:DUF2971 domain-containing protein n=1 Tax=Shewanella baltica TaxID=62322 RepID=UPI0021679A58|nr:DUF2971 domain-containing protein [Shewanella baltica]MCS6116231.1 DUF2971 domain-containing protein [Shewanella baltica]UVW66294.1 DUF2971 domain-containing protein [Shewanella baltica]